MTLLQPPPDTLGTTVSRYLGMNTGRRTHFTIIQRKIKSEKQSAVKKKQKPTHTNKKPKSLLMPFEARQKYNLII